MPDLGKYAFAIWASYGAGIGLLALLVVQSVMRQRALRVKIRQIEGDK